MQITRWAWNTHYDRNLSCLIEQQLKDMRYSFGTTENTFEKHCKEITIQRSKKIINGDRSAFCKNQLDNLVIVYFTSFHINTYKWLAWWRKHTIISFSQRRWIPYHPNTSTSHHIISQHTHNVITLSFKESTHQNGAEGVYNRYWAKSFSVLHFDDRKTIDFAIKYNYVNKIDLLMKSLMFQKRWMLPNKKVDFGSGRVNITPKNHNAFPRKQWFFYSRFLTYD